VGDEEDPAMLQRRGMALAALASVEAQKRHWEDAESLQRAALDAFTAAYARDPAEPESAARRVSVGAGLLVILDNSGQHDKSAAEAEEVARAVSELAAGSGPSDPRGWVALGYASAATAVSRAARDDITGAKEAFAQARADVRHADLGALAPDWQDVVASVWMNLCATSVATDDQHTRIEACSTAVATRRAELAAADPDHVVRQAELAHALFGLGAAHKQAGAMLDAAAAMRESADTGARLLAREPQNVTAAYYRGSALAELCSIEVDVQGGAAAMPDCAAARATLEALLAARPDDVKAIAALGRAWRTAYLAYSSMDRAKDALAAAEAALERFKVAAEKSPNSDIQRSDLSGGYRDVAESQLLLHDWDAARDAIVAGIALDEKQLADHPAATFYEWHVGEMLLILGAAERGRGHASDARGAYDRALAHFERCDAAEFRIAMDMGLTELRIATIESDPRARALAQKRADDIVAGLVARGQMTPGIRAALAEAAR
jgi:hypothetical protein